MYTSRTTDLRAQVFLLEGDLQPKIRRAMLGQDVDMPHVSNSYFSARALVNYPERRKQLPPTDHYKQRFLDATSRARIKVATSARRRGLRISKQLMHTGELRRLVVLLHAREQAPRRQDVQGLFAATACAEINQ